MKHWKTISVAAVAVAMSASAFAQGTTRTELNPWLDCGIGAMIFPSANLEVGAGLSNIIWDLGTTAVISAQSSPDQCNGTDNVEMAMFIQRTYATLEAEVAKGEGENLVALGELMGVEDQGAFVVALREEFAPVVASGEARAETLYFAAKAATQLG